MTRKYIHKIILTLALMLFVSLTSNAQYASEEELKTAANEMFEEADYVGSIKLFGQLLSNYPKDASYNYKYGACVLFGSRDKDNALRYLKFAITKPNVNPEAFYFLAKAYHHNYEFSAAIVQYNKFKEKASSKQLQKFKTDRDIKMCENGQQLIRSMADIGVLSKKEIKESDFFRSYQLNGIGGKILVKPDDFKTKYDLKKKEKSVIYIGEKKDMVVYSSLGKSGSTGKDIYKVVRLASGEWGEPTLLSNTITSEFDEDYPFLHPDGETLYFSSKGFNSMGGFDIFKSTLDASGQWSVPENLDFPINTPDDDILYISDIDNKLAYFASSRASKQGELTVYNVTVESTPSEYSIIKGFFLAEANPSMKSAVITVRDVEKDRRYGIFRTDNTNGEYLLTFPSNGGKFKILVETTESAPVHSAVIDIPKLDGFRALKQELRLVGTGDNEKLVVKNLFDESDEFDMNDPLIVQNLLKRKANLDVNTTADELNNAPEAASPYSKLSDDDIVNKTNETASKIIAQTAKSKEQVNTTYQIANTKSALAKEMINELNILAENGEYDKAERKKMEAAKLINEVVAALALANTLDNEVVERESDLQKVKSLQENVNASIDSGNRSDAENNLAALDEIASATYHKESALKTEEELLTNDLVKKQIAYNKDRDAITEYKNRKYELAESVNQLETEYEITKKKNDKAELQTRIDVLKIDIEDADFDIDNATNKEVKSKKAYTAAKNKVVDVKSIIAALNEEPAVETAVESTTKLQLENDIVFFEKEGLVGVYQEESAIKEPVVSESYNLAEHSSEFKVIDETGEIIDYNTKYSSQIAEASSNDNEEDRLAIVMKINESWINDIEEEITIRENQIAIETDLGKKINLTEKVATLEALKAAKQKELEEGEELIAENNSVTTEVFTPVEENASEIITSENGVAENTEKDEVNIMNTDGSLIDYETQYSSQLATIEDKDDFETYTEKSKIHENWASATEQEILIKKMELVEAEAADKNGIENEIAILESNLIEQQEFSALYAMQAESIEPATEEPLATVTTEESVLAETIENTEEAINKEIDDTTGETNATEEAIENSEELTAGSAQITSNTITESYSGDDYETNYKAKLAIINDEETYETTMQKVAVHNNWANTIATKIAERKATMASANDDQKNELANEIAILESDLIEQQEFASLYEMQAETMKPVEPVIEEPLALTEEVVENEAAETGSDEVEVEDPSVEEVLTDNQELEPVSSEERVSNQLLEENLTKNNLNATEDDFSNLKYNNKFNYTSTQSKTVLANVMALKEEAKGLKLDAEAKQNEANEISSEDEKEAVINEANDLIEQSQRKQEQVAKVYENANRNEYYNNQALISKLNAAKEGGESDELIRAEMIIEESDNYYDEAKEKREEVVNASNFTEKERILQEAYELEMKAIEKQLMAINTLSDKAVIEPLASTENSTEEVENTLVQNSIEEPELNKELTIEEPEVVNEISTSENSTLNTDLEIQPGDKEAFLALDPVEVVAIKNSESYIEFAALKAKKRRLVKEAEVEYIEAQKIEKEVKSQKLLDENLKAELEMASAQGGDEEMLSRIEKIEAMIADNEAKSATLLANAAALKASAATKENGAKEVNDTLEYILINAEESDAENYTVIEKIDAFDEEFMADVMGENTSEPIEEETLATVGDSEILNEEEPLVAEEGINTEDPIVEEENTAVTPVVEEEVATIEIDNNTEELPNVEPAFEATVTSNTIPENIDEIPSVLSESIFVINKNKAAYSANKRIPVSSKLPEGLVFKVQIGAFRNPIPQDHFKGFAPILAENAGNGITRYTAGLFKSFNVADEAKKMIRDIGYNDAFVVGFFNGKRINMTDALAMVNENKTSVANDRESDNTKNNELENQNSGITSNNETVENNIEIEREEINPITTPEVEDGVSTDVRNIEGAFYAIQVGVYSKEVTAGQLNNVSPLNSERTASGLIRYTSGVYKTLADANAAKDRIRGLGIVDAFVVAYKAGNKVTVAEATAALEGSNTSETPDVIPKEIEDVPEEIPVDISFKVQLGEYTEEVPVEEAGIFLKLNSRGVNSYEEGDKTVYVIGSFSDYQSALDLQLEMKEMGVINPQIITFNKGVKIEFEKALELIKNN